MRYRRGAACGAALAVAAAALLGGCTALGGPSESSSAALPSGVEVELYQLRSDVAERGAQVRIVNGSRVDLHVTGLTVEDDWFAGPAARDIDARIAAGRTVDLPFALPESVCVDEPDAAQRRSAVTLRIAAGEAAPRPVTVEVRDPLGFTDLLHVKECLRQDLASVVDLSWSRFEPSSAPEPAHLSLAITPTGKNATTGGDATAELRQIQTTNLLQFDAAPTPFPLHRKIDAADPASEVRVPIVPLRCDPHAVMEDKRGTVFNIEVAVAGESGVIEVAASEVLRGKMLRWVADWCGFGPG